MAQGTVKAYDLGSHHGSLLLDDRTEVAIDPASTQGTEVRYLRVGQRVDFAIEEDAGGRKVARELHIVTFS
jgi:cold shock CspA family protein